MQLPRLDRLDAQRPVDAHRAEHPPHRQPAVLDHVVARREQRAARRDARHRGRQPDQRARARERQQHGERERAEERARERARDEIEACRAEAHRSPPSAAASRRRRAPAGAPARPAASPPGRRRAPCPRPPRRSAAPSAPRARAGRRPRPSGAISARPSRTEDVAQRARGQRHAAAQRLVDARLGERVERALEVVEHRQERAQDARAGLRGLLLGEPRLALLVVVEVGREPAQVIEVLVALALEICDLILLGLGGRLRRRVRAPARRRRPPPRRSSGCDVIGSSSGYDRAWSPSSTISASSMTSSSASPVGGVLPPSAEPLPPVFW